MVLNCLLFLNILGNGTLNFFVMCSRVIICLTESTHGVRFSVTVVLGLQEARGRGRSTQARACSALASLLAGLVDLGLIASGLKASTFLLPTCRFQNELTQFAKPPVPRLRVVVEQQFECHCTVTSCPSHCRKWEERWKGERDKL